MGGHKMTGLADGEDDTDAVTVGQLTAALDASALPAGDLERGRQHDRGDAHPRSWPKLRRCWLAMASGRVPPSPR